uniref:Phospholipid/glycerol acyltransferase domain-containing protein n=1 Tax=Timema genevievae TaxID=629358 RepID=A0A7R9K128_TIMGE|nr:unnamed protein product [Timema genevievae]
MSCWHSSSELSFIGNYINTKYNSNKTHACLVVLSRQCGRRRNIETLDAHSGRQSQTPRRNWSRDKLWKPVQSLVANALLECILGTKIVVTGDSILPQEAALLVMNHRTRLDWNFLWAAMFHACQPMAHRLKFVLKASIRHLPGPGWVMQMACFLYIHRRWERDKALLSRTLDYFRDIGHNYQILIFPEGTDLNIGSQEKSHNFASTHNLERYYRVLHPKTTGFVFLAQRMKENGQLDAIYDITVGYPRTLPQSEVDLARGIFPEEVHFNIRRFPGNSIPSEEEAMKQWLETIWKQKEETLDMLLKPAAHWTQGRRSRGAGEEEENL